MAVPSDTDISKGSKLISKNDINEITSPSRMIVSSPFYLPENFIIIFFLIVE